MNKALFFLLASSLTAIAYAQTSQGNMMVGGSFEFNSTSYHATDLNNYSSFQISPSFGYFISDNFAVGANLGISTSRNGIGAGKTFYTSFGLGPFARYYFFMSNEKFAFFGDADLSFAVDKTNPPSGNTSRGSHVRFALSPGAVYFLNEHWAAEPGIGGLSVVSRNHENNNDDSTSFRFALSSFGSNLGVRYHF